MLALVCLLLSRPIVVVKGVVYFTDGKIIKKKWRIPNVPSLAFITIILLLFLLLICTGIFPSNFYITFQVLSVTVNFIFNQASGKTKVDKREV